MNVSKQLLIFTMTQPLFYTDMSRIKVFVYEASIINLSGIDAIVNAANEDLVHADDVAYHIFKAAGGKKCSLEIECRNYIRKNKKVHVTKNFTSSAGNLPYVGVIHAVGPMWSDYRAKDDCAKDLCMTIINVIMEADKKKFLKIAVPAISSGICGVPKRLCAEMYIRGVVDYDRQNPKTCVREIHFVNIAKDILKEIRDAYERWKQNDNNINFKNANNYRSGSGAEFGKSTYAKGSMHGNPAASWKSNSKMSIFHLSEKTCVKLYTCSIVDVKDVDAVACAIDTDFNVKRRAVAKAIRRAGGIRYEEEFQNMVSHVSPNSREDVFICGAGNLCRSNNIAYVIHIKVPKHFDMKLVRHRYIQVFETARKWTMEKIAMPLIWAANLVNASEDDIYECSCLFANTLKEVIEFRGEDMTVKEIHLVDLDEKIISLQCRAFQDTMDSNINQTVRATRRKPSLPPKPEKELPVPKSDGDQRNVENLSGTCSFDKCKRKVERRCKNCLTVSCKLCIMDVDSPKTMCPFCWKKFNSEEKQAKIEKHKKVPDIPSNEVDNCPICMEALTSPKMLPCGHKFHAECIDQSLKYKKTCPICGQVVGKLTGYQPLGKMYNQIREDTTPPGFEKCGTIEISYDFPDGTQGEDHPYPGMPYQDTSRREFLPSNTEGQKVAFDRKLNFTIGESRTTVKKIIATWSDIHHKTRKDGGPTNFGYPDETYLKRVQEEFADIGVTEEDITGTPPRDRLVQEASGSDYELSSDFVEGPEWNANDGRNCVLLLLIKYRMVQGKTIIRAVKSIPCTWNFLAYWNFYTKTEHGKILLDDIVKKYGCSVTLCTGDEDLFIFEVTGTNFRQESDTLHFVNDVLHNIYEGAKQSLCCEFCSVSHRIQEDTLKRVKDKKELHSAWIELVGEHYPDAIYVVCTMKDKVSVLNALTEIISEIIQSNMRK